MRIENALYRVFARFASHRSVAAAGREVPGFGGAVPLSTTVDRLP